MAKKDKIIELKYPEAKITLENPIVRIPLREIIKKILPELRKDFRYWLNNLDKIKKASFIDYLEDEYAKK